MSTLRVVFDKAVMSREDVHALPAAEQAQFVEAAKGIIGKETLPEIFAWCDREEMGWYRLLVEREGARAYELWINSVLDDGIFFAPGEATPSGFGVCQTRVEDMAQDREDVVAALQKALDAFEDDRPHQDWARP